MFNGTLSVVRGGSRTGVSCKDYFYRLNTQTVYMSTTCSFVLQFPIQVALHIKVQQQRNPSLQF